MAISFDGLFDIAGKTALVTGGSRGIGEMIAAGFLANGAKVYISSRKAAACDETAKRLSETYSGECVSLPADLSQIAGVDSLAERFAEREEKLDILVNNAGAAWGAPLGEFPEAGWDKVMDTNVKGLFFLTQKLLPQLRKAAAEGPPARVINIGSVDGLKSAVFDTFSYGASKAAVHHLSRFLAAHLTKERILVNVIAPGPFPTWMLSTGVGFRGETEGVDWDRVGRGNPSGRVGTPQDIAGLAIFLASRAGEYVVGQTIACDGGAVGVS
jgi:NAD(P)-dependent dehydrogenase (short-subunit alcohol dehydrogenase family)